MFRCKFYEALLDRTRGSLGSLAVQVGAGRRGGCRRIGHFARIRRRDLDSVDIDLQFLGNDLGNLGEKALAHFRAAMIEMHGTVLVDMQQRPGLVQMRRRKRNAEFDRRQCDAPFDNFVSLVELPDLIHTAPVVGAFFEVIDDFVNDVVVNRLQILRSVPLTDAVEILAAYIERIFLQMSCDIVNNAYSMANMPCGPPKPRNAVFDTVFVLQRCDTMVTFSRK